MMRDRTAREAALDAEVKNAAEEIPAFIDAGQWPEGLARIQRTQKLLVAGGRADGLRAALRELNRDLAMAQGCWRTSAASRASRSIVSSAPSGTSGDRLSAQPESRSMVESSLDGNAVDADTAYARAFQDYGIDLAALSVVEAAERIAGRIRLGLTRALDVSVATCAVARPTRSRRIGSSYWTWPGQQILIPARTQLRDAFQNRDRKALEVLAASADGARTLSAQPGSARLCSVRCRHTEQAISLLRQARRQYPEDLWLNIDLGDFCLQAGQYNDSVRFHTAASALRPRNPWLSSAMGVGLLAKGLSSEAIAQLTRAIELDPKAVWPANRACAYLELKQFDKARADCSKAIELDPKSAVGWANRGNAHLGLGKVDKALADYSKAIELSPTGAVIWLGRCGHYYRLGQLDKALADCSKAIELDPKNAHAWTFRGVVYIGLGQLDKAVADCTRAIDLKPKYAFVWASRSEAYRGLKQWNNAVADSTKAIQLDLRLAAAWTSRGNAYYDLKQWDKAIADFTMAIGRDPKYVNAWIGRGMVYHKLKQWVKAIADYAKAIEVDPKNAYGHNDLALLLATAADPTFRDSARAVDLAKKAIDLAPKTG